MGITVVHAFYDGRISGVGVFLQFFGKIDREYTELLIGLGREGSKKIIQDGIISVYNGYNRQPMKHIFHYINRLIKSLKTEHFLFLGILLIFLTNTLYVTYPDEFVNILGGKFINMGKIPYREFFDHHLPFAWYFSAVLLWFSHGSYVVFRTLWALFAFAGLFLVGRYLKKTKPDLYPYYLGYFAVHPLITVYYWTHLFLADSLAFLFFSMLFWVLVAETYKKNTSQKVIYILLMLNFAFLFSSMTYVFIAMIFYLWIGWLQVRRGWDWKAIFRFKTIAAAPYLIYGIYLLVTNSLRDFYISNVVYNTTLYISIPNYTKGHFFNPLKFTLTVFYNFFQTYIPLLVRIKEFNLFFPVDLVLALGSFLLLIFFFFENKILFALFFLVLSFSAPRSNLMKIGETDYQVGLFIALGFSAAFMVLWRYKHIVFKEEYLDYFKKAATTLLVFFMIFAALFLAKNTYDKYYMRYTQRMPGIYDVAYTAWFIDDVLNKGEYYWVGPYEPNELFFVKKALLPGKYISLLPQFREDSYFSGSFLAQFETHPPELIIYKHEASIFMTPALEFGKFFTDWMADKYTSIEHIKGGIELIKSPSTFNMRTDLYLRNSSQSELLRRLREKGYIK